MEQYSVYIMCDDAFTIYIVILKVNIILWMVIVKMT